jgi:hypothetical protein
MLPHVDREKIFASRCGTLEKIWLHMQDIGKIFGAVGAISRKFFWKLEAGVGREWECIHLFLSCKT